MELPPASIQYCGISIQGSPVVLDRVDAPPCSPSQRSVDVWQASAALSAPQLGALEALLDPKELATARRFARDHDRHLYVSAHGARRLVLARNLRATAKEVEFREDASGKPSLGGRFTQSAVRFSLSHSSRVSLIAVSGTSDVGVDVEYVPPSPVARELCAAALTPRECQDLWSLPSLRASHEFMQIWTRKEAALKATGLGLRVPMNSFPASGPDYMGSHTISLRASPHIGTRGAQVLVADLDCQDGYVGAVGVILEG